jgi:amidase
LALGRAWPRPCHQDARHLEPRGRRERPTTNGVVAFKDVIAPGDAPVISNWCKAGAIIIGRTNTPAFSWRWFTDNDLHGRTFSPWNRAVTPGGSSGGAAAAVAAGIGPLAHGNDIGGSVRYRPMPAASPEYGRRSAAFRPSTLRARKSDR